MQSAETFGLFDADGSGTAFCAWKAWPVVRQANPHRDFLETRAAMHGKHADTVFVWGMNQSVENRLAKDIGMRDGSQMVFCEDGLLKSADTWANHNAPLRYRRGCSVMFDTRAPYFDGTKPSDLELLLNNPSFTLSSEERSEASRLMKRITAARLTKYNHQPLECHPHGRPDRPKVLVIDQSYGDFSVSLGMADEATFDKMLSDAASENPDSDILVKTHPDALAGERTGYYDSVRTEGHVFRVAAPVNPYALIDMADKVYVCSTQLGFEALMSGKEVHVYGMPFYAGWGLTIDKQTCSRRTIRRSIEEVFYAVYMKYTKWVNPGTGQRCSIDEAIDWLVSMRREYALARKFFFIRKAARHMFGRVTKRSGGGAW